MEGYRTVGHKDIWSIFLVLLNGLSVLILINAWAVLILLGWDIPWYYYLAIVVFGFGFYVVIRIVNGISYEFDKSGITINSVGNKKYFIEKHNIEKVEYIGKESWFKGFGVRYNFFTGEVLFTTGLNNIYKIYTTDGRQILISPKIFKKEFFTYFNY
ncbi:hypothetical protein [Candidatus Absconditicoccus praedator]|uniref:hypothetical protein n=1 Tax=Candidatus Absconditicoccus praedator TaxID=2735562 RepID=UPI001E61D71E|nr:hypothetical protein [Candidatus Absconditicoccus praedator]UFX82646.1 hypothetical protein HLG78_00645 [Candidatus Absconditicoccus praedator]